MSRTEAATSYAELNAVLDRAARPSATAAEISDAQLVALQHRWTTALSARLDQAIEGAGAEPLVDAVAAAWRALAEERPTLRVVLDANGPIVHGPAGDVEAQMLALAAGLADLDDAPDAAARLGRSYRELIRSGNTEDAPALRAVA